jgi:gliding motility-associated-like protein
MKQRFFILILLFCCPAWTFAQISLNFNITPPSCYLYPDGSVNMTITGGTSPYTVAWYQNGNLIASQEDISGISDGIYVVNVSDSTGLNVIDTVALAASYQITSIDTILDALCYGSNGSINITPQGGNGFYLGTLYPLVWDTWNQIFYVDSAGRDTQYTVVDTLNFFWSKPAGHYWLIITDLNGSGCSVVKEIVIKQPTAPVTFTQAFTHNICKYDSTGMITCFTSGGTPPYTWNWSHGPTTPGVTQLPAGTYTVTVSDSHGCYAVQSTDIQEPFQPVILVTDSADVSCRDNHDGMAAVLDVENVASPYIFSWSTGDSTNAITDLDSGYYSVTVTDQKGCTATREFHLDLTDCDCIVIYNVVTPDGNGKNDTWQIKNIDLYPNASVQVFNRWGKMVYSKDNGYNNDWDGKSEGDLLDSGDYYYVVKLNMRNYPPYTGPVKILK